MSSPQWLFGGFRLDPDNACLWRGAQAIALTPKAFDVLHYLVTHPDRLVTKDTLLDAVWPETAVSDAVVRIAIGELRRALGDTVQAPRFIATVPRRGYRFLAPVTWAPTRDGPDRGAAATCAPAHAPGRAPHVSAHALHWGSSVRACTRACPLAYTPTALAEKIRTARAALEGERKQVTVLFADIKDSLELIHGLDPEAAQQLLDPALHAMMDAVHRYEGTVNQVLGDGIMALFGAPIAHEDHALRACYAALAMQAALGDYAEEVRRTHGVALQSRIGLNSGEVVVRTIRNDLQMDYSAVGQTTHLAARMEQVAPPDTILLTAATVRLVEGLVRVKAWGPVPVKGLAEPVEVFELLGASGLRRRLQTARARGLTRFVGRQTELAALHTALAQAGAGHGHARHPAPAVGPRSHRPVEAGGIGARSPAGRSSPRRRPSARRPPRSSGRPPTRGRRAASREAGPTLDPADAVDRQRALVRLHRGLLAWADSDGQQDLEKLDRGGLRRAAARRHPDSRSAASRRELDDGDLRPGADPHRRAPVAGAAGDVELGVAVPAQPLDGRLVQPDHVVEGPQLPAVGVAGQLQVDAGGRAPARPCTGWWASSTTGVGVVPAVQRGVEVRAVAGHAGGGRRPVVDAGEVEGRRAAARSATRSLRSTSTPRVGRCRSQARVSTKYSWLPVTKKTPCSLTRSASGATSSRSSSTSPSTRSPTIATTSGRCALTDLDQPLEPASAVGGRQVAVGEGDDPEAVQRRVEARQRDRHPPDDRGGVGEVRAGAGRAERDRRRR